MSRPWTRTLAAIAVAWTVALAGLAGLAQASAVACDRDAAVARCDHDRGLGGAVAACPDQCRAAPAVTMGEQEPRAPSSPRAAIHPAEAQIPSGLAWDVPVRPPKGLG